MVIQWNQSAAALMWGGIKGWRERPTEPQTCLCKGQSADASRENDDDKPVCKRRVCPSGEPCVALNLNDKMH